MTEFRIREIKTQDLIEIAKIHKASFHDRVLTKMGIGPIKRYYSWLLSGFSTTYPICAETITGKVIGYCFAGIYAGSFGGFLMRNKCYLFGSMLLKPWLIFDPLVRSQIKMALPYLIKFVKFPIRSRGQKLSKKKIGKKYKQENSLGVLSIATHPQFQRKGVGQLLLQEVEIFAQRNNYSQLHLSVHPSNLQAVRFYSSLGWEKLLYDTNWEGKMHKRLD